MKRYIVLAVVVSAFLVGALNGCKKEDVATTPVLDDGSQYRTTDGGKSWQKLVGCTCDCSENMRGTYPGTCKVGAYEYTCQDWCTYGGKR